MSVPSTTWNEMRTMDQGDSLAQLCAERPVLLVFLRQFGCSFCREAITDIAKKRSSIEALGVRIVMVHMAPDQKTAEKYFKRFKLFPVDHVSDPEKQFYKAFGLLRGTSNQLFGLMNWVRGFQSVVLEGHGFEFENAEIGDGFQMPGVFVVRNNEILDSFIHQYPYDRPDYEGIVSCCKI